MKTVATSVLGRYISKTVNFHLLLLFLSLMNSDLTRAQTPTKEQLSNDPPLFLKLARTQLKWDEPAAPAKIVGPIYSISTKGLGIFLIKSLEGLIVINTGMPGSGPMTETAIRKLGFDPQDIKLILIGHAHSDHAGAVAYLKKISGAKVAIIKEEQQLLESGGKTDFHYANYEEFAFEPVKAGQVFHDREVLRLGDVSITALLTNGHTQGSTTFITEVVDNGKKYAVVFPNGLSINPGYRIRKNPSYPGIEENFRRTLSILEKLQPDIWLFPHTETFDYEGKLARTATEGVNAWVDPEGYHKWLKEQRKSLEATIEAEMAVAKD